MTTDEWLDTSLTLHVSNMLPNPVVKKPCLQTAADCCRFKRHYVDHSSSHVLLVRTWTLNNRHTSEAEKGRPTSHSCSQHKLSMLTWRNCTVTAQDDGRSEHPTHRKCMSAVGHRGSAAAARASQRAAAFDFSFLVPTTMSCWSRWHWQTALPLSSPHRLTCS